MLPCATPGLLLIRAPWRGSDPRRTLRSEKNPSNAGPGLREDGAQDLLDQVEVLLRADQRRGQLDDGVAAVVGAADQAGVEQRVRQEAAQQPLGLVVVERLLGDLVL